MENKNKMASWVKFIPMLVFIVFWEWIANYIESGVYFFGSPTTIAASLWERLLDGRLAYDTGITLLEVIVGFIIGNITGTVLGLSFWYNSYIAEIIRPYMLALGSIPVIALAPVIIIFFGIGLWSKIILVIISTVVVATIQAFEGANQANPSYIALLRSFGASRFLIFKKIIVPSSLVWIFTGFKLNIGFAILGAFLGEYISADAGLGNMIIKAMGLFKTPVVFAGVVMIAVVSLVLNSLVSLLQKKLLPWKYNSSKSSSYAES